MLRYCHFSKRIDLLPSFQAESHWMTTQSTKLTKTAAASNEHSRPISIVERLVLWINTNLKSLSVMAILSDTSSVDASNYHLKHGWECPCSIVVSPILSWGPVASYRLACWVTLVTWIMISVPFPWITDSFGKTCENEKARMWARKQKPRCNLNRKDDLYLLITIYAREIS